MNRTGQGNFHHSLKTCRSFCHGWGPDRKRAHSSWR